MPPCVTAHAARSRTGPCGISLHTVAFALSTKSFDFPAAPVATTCTGSSASAASAYRGQPVGHWRGIQRARSDHLYRIAPLGMRILERLAAGRENQRRAAPELVHGTDRPQM